MKGDQISIQCLVFHRDVGVFFSLRRAGVTRFLDFSLPGAAVAENDFCVSDKEWQHEQSNLHFPAVVTHVILPPLEGRMLLVSLYLRRLFASILS
jgi:hypothetical protein